MKDVVAMATLGCDEQDWTEVGVNRERPFDGFLVQGMVVYRYRHPLDTASYTMARFCLHGTELFRAWGIVEEPCCSFHQVTTADGLRTAPIAGCPQLTVDVAAGELRFVLGEGEVYRVPAKFTPVAL